MSCELTPKFNEEDKLDLKQIERSIIKGYRKDIWKPFIKAITEFNLIEEGDKIGVCISGGKDSFLLAKLLQELQKHGKFNFEIFFMSMDPGFNEINRKTLEENANYLDIPLQIKDSDVFSIAEKLAGESPCYMCARMRRGFLYSFAKENGCNKIALGHHYDDVIQTTMMNLIYAGSFKTMMPRLKAQNFEDMELIRPMYYIREDDVIRFSKNTKINFMNCGCTVTANKTATKRTESRQIIEYLNTLNPDAHKSIMKSASNVYLDAVLGYKQDGKYTSFLDNYS